VDSGLWVLPPLSKLTTEPAIIQKMWGLYEPSQRKMGEEWVEFPKLELETSSHIWEFYRHSDLFNSVRCDKAVQEYWYNHNSDIDTPYRELKGWDRQAVQLYADCYHSALNIKQELNSG
jgi:hypothetical protein